MRSLYDDIITTLEATDFSIPNVSIRNPYDATPKTYPALTVHEIVNVPHKHVTVHGEQTTMLSYQIDIETQTSITDADVVLSAYVAGRVLVGEVSDALETAYKLTRRTTTSRKLSDDVHQFIWRGDVVLDSYGYTYRQ